jgi:hypothetical protein
MSDIDLDNWDIGSPHQSPIRELNENNNDDMDSVLGTRCSCQRTLHLLNERLSAFESRLMSLEQASQPSNIVSSSNCCVISIVTDAELCSGSVCRAACRNDNYITAEPDAL